VTPALRQLHWLPVAVNQMRSGLRSADTAQYIKPRCRTEIGKRALSYAGPLAWNDLPPSLHCITDSKRFRKHLQTHYFNRTFVDYRYVRQAISALLLLLLLLLFYNSIYMRFSIAVLTIIGPVEMHDYSEAIFQYSGEIYASIYDTFTVYCSCYARPLDQAATTTSDLSQSTCFRSQNAS